LLYNCHLYTYETERDNRRTDGTKTASKKNGSKQAFSRVNQATYDIKYSTKFVPLRTPH
jgi:hypothetical protein